MGLVVGVLFGATLIRRQPQTLVLPPNTPMQQKAYADAPPSAAAAPPPAQAQPAKPAARPAAKGYKRSNTAAEKPTEPQSQVVRTVEPAYRLAPQGR